MTKPLFPSAFIWRRLQSLAGFGLVIFIIFHLITNSQAALFGDDGRIYIESVNAIQHMPYLRIMEVLLLAIPLLIHSIWGVYYLTTGQSNSYANTGHTPYLPEYNRNHAYTWQRLTSYLLLIGIVVHVLHMRFVDAPVMHNVDSHITYTVPLTDDPGLNALADRLDVKLDHQKDQVIAVAKDFGTAELLMVRDAFKEPWIMGFYTIFVLAACFHAFNGLWTFMITWGVTLSVRVQRLFLWMTTALMFLMTFLGLATIYLTYWVNLR